MQKRAALLLALALAVVPPGGAAAADPLLTITDGEALAQDAAHYATRYEVPLAEAIQRLRAQEESVRITDLVRETYRGRVAGISIEHRPDFRIVVLLTGAEPVADRVIRAGGMDVPIIFRTGASATQEELATAISRHQAAIRFAVPNAQGMGVDTRTGELVLLVRSSEAESLGVEEMDRQAEAIARVPVRIRVLGGTDTNLGLEGGARVEGVDPLNGKRYACTTGFVVTNGARTGVATAAHCPDMLSYRDPERGHTTLEFIGQWGARFQDVQIHVGNISDKPLFYADRTKQGVRAVTSWRNRTSTRVGDAVCHRGETTGYSCSEVELVDFAPPGDLCAGLCDPVWVSVTGPFCKSGDSGGPVFSGTVAFGITKGGSYSRGRCNFFYYMSTDFLPEGWTLLHRGSSAGPVLPP